MLNIKTLKDSWYFREVHLEKAEVVFKEWEVNENIYIVLAWELVVEKLTSKQWKESKILAYLRENDVFGEAALNNNNPKQVSVTTTRKTVLLVIWAQKLLNVFSIKYKQEAFNLMRYIVFLSNKRLSESNYLITANYKIAQEIKKLDEISYKAIFEILEKMKEALWVSDIIFYEVNPVMENYLTLKYDTRFKWKMQNEIIEITDNKLDLLDLKVDDYYNFTQKLGIWRNDLWYLIFLKKDFNFNETDRKVLSSISSSLSWLIKQKQLLEEDKNKEYMEM